MPYCSATALIVYVLGFLLTPIPSPRAGSSCSTSNTRAAILSSLPKLLSATLPALRQTDVPWRPDCAATAHRDRVVETFVPIACPAECATATSRQLSALRSSRRALLPEL